jgi:hypothetical protein
MEMTEKNHEIPTTEYYVFQPKFETAPFVTERRLLSARRLLGLSRLMDYSA